METLIKLMDAWKAGTDCRDQIHDCLIDMGYPHLAWLHFECSPCRNYTACSLGNILWHTLAQNEDWLRTADEDAERRHNSYGHRNQA